MLAQAEFIEDALLDRFYGYESPLGMHPDIKVAGVEMSTGGLGHGLAVGVGMALGARIQESVPHVCDVGRRRAARGLELGSRHVRGPLSPE